MASVTQNFDAYVNLDKADFGGLWVAIFKGEVIASGEDAKMVYKEAMKITHNKIVMLSKVPKKDVIEIL